MPLPVTVLGRLLPPRVRARLRAALRNGGTPSTVRDEQQLDERARTARDASDAGDWATARVAWEAVVTGHGDHAPVRAHVELVRALRQLGDLPAAEQAVAAAATKHPGHPLVVTELAQLAGGAGDWDLAASHWAALIASGDGAEPRNYVRLSRARRHGGDLDAAVAAITEGIDRFPTDADLRAEYAQAASSAHDWPEAVIRWRAVLDLPDAPPHAYVQTARAHQRLGDLEAAYTVATTGLEAHPSDVAVLDLYARLAVAERDWDEATSRLQALVDAHHDPSPRLYRDLARVQTEAGEHDGADRTLRLGLDRHPHDVELLVERARLAGLRSDWDDAVRRWEHAQSISAEPIPPELQAGFAHRCASAFRHELAERIVDEALRDWPDHPVLLRQRVRNATLGQQRTRAPSDWDWSDALERSHAYLAAHPDLPTDDVLALATLLSEASALGEAVTVIDAALARSAVPDEAHQELPLRVERTQLQMALGRWSEVIPVTREEHEGDVADRDRIVTARAHQARGDLPAALSVLEPLEEHDQASWARERARAHTAVGEDRGAVEAWAAALEHEPESLDLRRRAATALRRVGAEHDARSLIEESDLERNPGVVAIIGGGPSLSGVDLEPLRGVAHCVAVNATATMLPWCDVAVTHDPSHLVERFRGFPGQVVAGLSAADARQRGRIPGFEFRRRFVTDRLSELDDVVHSGGHTSAHTALNYAYLLQPTRIVLFGIDLTEFWGPNDYWHGSMDAYNRRRFQTLSARPAYDEWHEYRSRKLRNAPAVFTSTVPQLERARTEVWNASPVSSVTCFPRVAPEEGIRRCLEDSLT